MNTVKRTLAILLAVCMVFALAIPAYAADDHTHEYTKTVLKAPTCTANGVAKFVCACGDLYYASIPAAHAEPGEDAEIVEPTCAKDGSLTYVCSGCGETISSVLPATGKHNYQETVCDATCTDPQRVGSFCSVCGKENPDSPPQVLAPALGHDFTVEKEVVAPGCTEDGYTVYKCSRCDETKKVEVPAVGHKYNNGEVVDASCEAGEGVKYTCTVCGATRVEELPGGVGKPATGHTWGEYVSDNAGKHTRTCEVCGKTETGDCEYDSVLTAATHTDHAYTTYTCSVCGYSYKEIDETSTLDPNHTYIQSVIKPATCTTAGVAKLVCSAGDGATNGYQSIPASHTWDDGEVTKAATCTEAGEMTFVCSVCKETKTEVIPAAGHKLTWVTLPGDEPTCGTPGKRHQECTVCDYAEEPVEIPATGEHTFVDKLVDADCTHPDRVGSFCSVCGAADPDKEVTEVGTALGHSYTEEITTKPTCDEKGVKTLTCSRCGDIKTEEIAALGHDYQSTGMEEATCEEPAYDVQECTRCGDVQKIEITGEAAQPALGHDFVKDTVVEPTCTEDGYTVYKCSRCGETENRNVVTTTGAHTAEIVTVLREATCTTNGVGKTACKYCGKAMGYQSIPASHKWDDGEVTKAATCTEAGEMTFVCSVCKATKTEEIQALGHDIVFITDAEPTCGKAGEGHNECLTCGYKEDAQEIEPTGEHTFVDKLVDADCTHPDRVGSFCSVCGAAEPGKEVTEVGTALGHSYTEEITTKPTCDEKGVKTFTCSRCGVSYTEEIAALGHDYQSTGMEDATCTAPAYDVEECTRCGDVRKTEITGEAAQPALGHDFVKDTVVEPTCTEDGYTVYKCSRCGETENRDVVTTTGAHTAEIVTVLREATCTTNGVGKTACKYCGKAMGYQSIPASHKWDDGEVTKAATCTKAGEMTFVCSVCKATKTEEIQALGHDIVFITDAEPTCGKAGEGHNECLTCGYKEDAQEIPATGEHTFVDKLVDADCTHPDRVGSFCSVCGAADPDKEVTEVGTALGHSYTEEITTKPTCDEKGVKTFTCSRCGDSYTEEIAALGHDYQSTGMEEATCEEPAYDVQECTRCGKKQKTVINGEDGQPLYPALGHDFVEDTVVEPTCTEDGYTVYKCSHCGKTEHRDVVTTTGAHTAEIVTVLREATCSATGVGKAVCKYCKTSMGYVVIPMTAHTYDDANSYVTEDQYLKVKCEVCGAEITLQDLNPCRNGHTWDEGEVTTEPTCTEKGVKTFTCTVKGCGATRTEDVEATGHDWQVVRDTEKKATCTEGGSCEYICSKCFDTKTETTDPLGHKYVDGVCTRCGESEPGQQPEPPDEGGEEQG